MGWEGHLPIHRSTHLHHYPTSLASMHFPNILRHPTSFLANFLASFLATLLHPLMW
jgi:hypothetical protein